MVNTNIQGPVPLDGVGFVARRKGDYLAGEYKKLKNVELTEGVIRRRRSIASVLPDASPSPTANPVINPFGFIGFLGEGVVTASKTHQRVSRYGDEVTLWAPTSLPVPAAAGSWHNLVGCFEYNNYIFWISHQYDASAFGIHKIYVHRASMGTLDYYNVITYAGLTTFLVTTVTGTRAGLVFDNFYIYKERLWITTNEALYFSKATDPTVWAVPDGGFFKLQGQSINYSVALADSIYMLCDNSIHLLNFSTDPNLDSQIRLISDNIGGDHGVVHQDTVYAINYTGVFNLQGTRVTRVISDLDSVPNSMLGKLRSFEDYLIVIRYAYEDYNKVASGGMASNSGRKFVVDSAEGTLNNNVWFINTTTGATHVLDYNDYPGDANPGYIVDMRLNPRKDFFRASRLYILTNKYDPVATASHATLKQYKGNISTMESQYSLFVYDTAVSTAGVVRRFKPDIEIEVDSFSPDGNEYLMKKFRNLMLMGNFPYRDFNLKLAFDNKDYPAVGIPILSNTGSTAEENRPHYPVRIPVNQRCRSVNIYMYTVNPTEAMDGPTGIYDTLEISDMRFLWSYTGRAPVGTERPV